MHRERYTHTRDRQCRARRREFYWREWVLRLSAVPMLRPWHHSFHRPDPRRLHFLGVCLAYTSPFLIKCKTQSLCRGQRRYDGNNRDPVSMQWLIWCPLHHAGFSRQISYWRHRKPWRAWKNSNWALYWIDTGIRAEQCACSHFLGRNEWTSSHQTHLPYCPYPRNYPLHKRTNQVEKRPTRSPS